MTTTTERAMKCPSWCTNHDDINRPGGSRADAPGYDEVAQGHFVHCADTTIAGVEVSATICTDWDGDDLDVSSVILNGVHEVTPAQTHDLGMALLEACRLIGVELAPRD